MIRDSCFLGLLIILVVLLTYNGITWPVGMDKPLRKLKGRIIWAKPSNCLRKGGKEAVSIPTESSIADQTERLAPSHVGSWVFIKADSSTVFTIEKDVGLMYQIS